MYSLLFQQETFSVAQDRETDHAKLINPNPHCSGHIFTTQIQMQNVHKTCKKILKTIPFPGKMS